MKLNPTEIPSVKTPRLLILSDGKPGHVNQSIAFARHLNYEYDLSQVGFRSRWAKALSYPADHLGIYSARLFDVTLRASEYVAVVSAGSETYYANRTLAKHLNCKSVAIMLPKGYRFAFDLIVAQQHDNPPKNKNIVSIPINLTYIEPKGLVVPVDGSKYISLIIGGDSAHGQMDAALLCQQIEQILRLFPEHKVWMTTSRRTPNDVETMLRRFQFERAIYYSQEPVNPIPDFLQYSEYVFLTADSSSMISEAVSFGQSCVEVLSFAKEFSEKSKFAKFIRVLSRMECLHLFDGSYGACCNKMSFADFFKGQIIEKF